MAKPKTVLTFGTFDGLHDGHLYLLNESAKFGDQLVVGIARDEHVRLLKNKNPLHGEGDRRKAVADLKIISQAVLCDVKLGSYEILKNIRPDIIVLGYDQDSLMNDLKWKTDAKLIQLTRYEPQNMD